MKIPSNGQKSLVIHRLLRIEQPWAANCPYLLKIKFVILTIREYFQKQFIGSLFSTKIAL